MPETAQKTQDLTANPAPLGLLGFGMTTVLLNLHNAGFFPINAMILGMGFFLVELHRSWLGLWSGKKETHLVLPPLLHTDYFGYHW